MFNSRLIDRDIEDWVFENWALLHQNFGPQKPLANTPLIQPKPGVFGAAEKSARATGKNIFETVRKLAGMADWPVELESFESQKIAQVSEFHHLNPSEQSPAGLFISDGQETPIIRYDIALVEKPAQLIATFAHELSHMLLLGSGVEEGYDPDIGELLTDLTAVYLGFGVFLANTAFEFEAHQGTFSQGWSSRRSGYLSENTLLLATALFLRTSGHPEDDAANFLKPSLKKPWIKALKQVDRRQDDLQIFLKRDQEFQSQ